MQLAVHAGCHVAGVRSWHEAGSGKMEGMGSWEEADGTVIQMRSVTSWPCSWWWLKQEGCYFHTEGDGTC